MKWIDSGGGPLIMVPRRSLSRWRGTLQGEGAEGETDYDRACAIDEYVGLIKNNGCEALVLGDEPLSTAVISGTEAASHVIVRWVFADSEEDVETTIAGVAWAEIAASVEVRLWLPGDCVIFDAAEAGDSILGDSISLEISPGTYVVDTHTLNPGPRTRVILHRLMLKE